MENSFASVINSANSILILLPPKPYFDQVAGGLALYLSLRGVKDVAISCPAQMLVEFNRLIGVNKISSELGNKNLTIKFRDYPAENIERVSADVDNSEFKLTVIPKTGFSSPKEEQVEIGFSGVGADLVILVGGGNESHFPALSEEGLSGAKTIHLGIKPLTVNSDKAILSFALPASSVSEVVALLLKDSGLALDPDIATNLISGIEEGSNHFTGADVSVNTFEVVAYLLRSGGRRIPKEGFVKKSYPPGAIPGQPARIATQSVAGGDSSSAPKDWFEPKIYKGNSVS